MALGECQGRFEKRILAWRKNGFLRRLWSRDSGLWGRPSDPAIANRLGWLDLPEKMAERLEGFETFAAEIRAEGFRHAVLLGMGGSSLAPEVFAKTFGSAPGHPELVVLDSTHPEAVKAVERSVDLPKTLFIVSSKSGTTVEPLALFQYFWSRTERLSGPPGGRFIAVTDPGTPLSVLARERRFRRIFEAEPDVGGRFSALTEFGLVPAALIGLDTAKLLASAALEARANGSEALEAEAPGLLLGAALGEIAASRDKLTIWTSPSLRSFPDWLEQLVAESTGKDGKGIVPVADEPRLPAASYGPDRVFASLELAGDSDRDLARFVDSLERAGHPLLRIRLEDDSSLGREIFRWEIAVAAAGAALGVQPFDQPDVELAKELARQAMAPGTMRNPAAEGGVPADDPAALRVALGRWLGLARPGDYVAIQAFLAPGGETSRALGDLRRALLKKTGLATTLGYGPRFLHSTGQLHKGGPDEDLILQLFDEPQRDLAVPESGFTFGELIRAQALGDYQALLRRGRRVLRVNLRSDPPAVIELLGKWAGT
jgi:transaldolase/glucose-6-phosphate isomerase